MPLMSLRSGLSQRSPADTKSASSLFSGRLAAPKARSKGPARGGFGGGSVRLGDDDFDAKTRCVVVAASAAASSSFFPSPIDSSQVRVRERPSAPGEGKAKGSRKRNKKGKEEEKTN